MARYIKFEDVLNALNEVRCSDCTNDKPLDCSLCQIGAIHRQILAKTVYLDVVPKSEVERLQNILDSYALQYGTVMDKHIVIEKTRAEVAREIFEEIERLLGFNSLQGDIFTGKYFDSELETDIAELKKKYTEGD